MTDETQGARPALTSMNEGLTPIRPLTIQEQVAQTLAQPAMIKVEQPAAQVLAPAKPSSSSLVKIAGLGNLVQSVRDQITELRTNGAALQESVAALNLTMQGIKQQVDATHDDLKFEAETMGNGSGS